MASAAARPRIIFGRGRRPRCGACHAGLIVQGTLSPQPVMLHITCRRAFALFVSLSQRRVNSTASALRRYLLYAAVDSVGSGSQRFARDKGSPVSRISQRVPFCSPLSRIGQSNASLTRIETKSPQPPSTIGVVCLRYRRSRVLLESDRARIASGSGAYGLTRKREHRKVEL